MGFFFFLLPIKWSIKQANWVETHSVRYSARHHLHNVKHFLIKRVKICYVWTDFVANVDVDVKCIRYLWMDL